ncbi:3-hydroxyisobutyryl-CoA hydrolase-like protein 1, mitochondrial [Heracleum sosnowskyi]|uniref:3-hydroxyisobutyryl-CoA hydrolase n=1 Tax=Heracleum sosnowskyi TaxID=360622 RepID=A0AAD8JAX7_9APIA|nr:3-hydroxyisobutyryl-CoA hydrolase-like protein 1, mitochondrial [Heracleum sosnowskyi]
MYGFVWRRCCNRNNYYQLLGQCQSTRRFSSLINNVVSDQNHLNNSVLVEGKNGSRMAILNRPSVLNALDTSMLVRLQKLYQSWEDNPDIGFVTLKGRGRAFCAGGDVVGFYRSISIGDLEAIKEFFWNINNLIYLINTYMKPHVALLNGITMGGGGGISIPGTFRVSTDKTVFATPEALIGYYPDAGASFYLSRLSGYLGEYLALTGDKLNGAEMIACGLATHYSLDAKLPLIEEQLGKLMTDDLSVVESSLEKYGDLVYPSSNSVLSRTETVDRCFSHDTVEEIIDSLEEEATKTNDPWCTATVKRLKEVSPLSLKVSLRSIREGRFQTLDQCLIREYRMTIKALSKQISTDFSEGVRSRLVDKDFAPKWDPPSLEKVSEDMVDQYFSRGSELELPTTNREAFT